MEFMLSNRVYDFEDNEQSYSQIYARLKSNFEVITVFDRQSDHIYSVKVGS